MRCRERSEEGLRCLLDRDHLDAFGHMFATPDGYTVRDDPPHPMLRPNWRYDRYPIHQPWWRRGP